MRELIKTKKIKGWTRKLGLFGLEGIETGLEIGLVMQNPVLFVGRHGTGKNASCEKNCGGARLEIPFL